jgi:hypothetical protein
MECIAGYGEGAHLAVLILMAFWVVGRVELAGDRETWRRGKQRSRKTSKSHATAKAAATCTAPAILFENAERGLQPRAELKRMQPPESFGEMRVDFHQGVVSPLQARQLAVAKIRPRGCS